MGRGKIEMKKIDNATNMQVTFSKRRSGIFKKAEQLSVLCDAQISLIMSSSNNKFYEFVTPTTTHKKIFDRYQKDSGVDLWQPQYQKMQEELRNLRDTNNKLGRAIRQRMGKDLHDMRFDEIFELEQTMISALDHVSKEKVRAIKRKKNTTGKKVRGMENEQRQMINMEARYEEGDYESEITTDGWTQLYNYQLAHHHGYILDPFPIRIP
ncbi:agamous-like MADS-box protein TM6 isoform X2 [Euphorbia lathyris]|uniref:agamous-like MADS-box protein TM6 isoform X2 n=1 Tax=Euphorbia lathyris TaxID=212925 RepID=UPI0033130BFB